MDIPLPRAGAPARTEASLISALALHPLRLGMAYLLLTIILFQFGPIDYPTHNRVWLLFYLGAAFALITAGFIKGASQAPRTTRFQHTRTILIIGALTSIVVLFPSAWTYTGRMPWDVLSAAQNQNASYFGLQDQLEATEGSRTWVVLLRVLTQPLSYAALPLGIIYWKQSNIAKVAAVSAAVASLIFSVLRGTDREVADLVIISLGAFLIARARARIKGTPPRKLPVQKIFAVFAAALVLLGAYNVFAQRKSDRMGTISAFCLGEMSGACADYNNPLVAVLPDEQKFAATMVTGYFTNGYYGLQLALFKPFEPMWGLGHSSGLQRLSGLLTGDKQLQYRTYEYRNRDDGWPGEYVWASAITAMANDVSFWGALVVLGAFGFLWARSWVNATFGLSDPAAVVFCLSMHTLLYLPANLQVLLTLEGYSTTIFWLVLWHLTTVRQGALR